MAFFESLSNLKQNAFSKGISFIKAVVPGIQTGIAIGSKIGRGIIDVGKKVYDFLGGINGISALAGFYNNIRNGRDSFYNKDSDVFVSGLNDFVPIDDAQLVQEAYQRGLSIDS